MHWAIRGVLNAFAPRFLMARKTKFTEVKNAVKTAAGAALGAAAVAATGVVAAQVAGAIRKGGEKLEDATPDLQRLAGRAVSKPLLPTRQRRAAATRKARSAKRRIAASKTKRRRKARR